MLTAFLVLFLLPLATHAAWWGAHNTAWNWSSANWSSSGMLPPPTAERQAVVHVLAGRTGGWKGALRPPHLGGREAGRSQPLYPLRRGRLGPAGARRQLGAGRAIGTATRRRSSSLCRAAAAGSDCPNRARRRRISLLGIRQLPGLAGPELEYVHRSHRPRGARARARACCRPRSARISRSACCMPASPERDRHPGLDQGPDRRHGRLGRGHGSLVLGAVVGVDIRRPALKLPGWGRIGLP